MNTDQSEWVVYHPPKSVSFGHVTNIRDPRRAWPRVQSFLNDYVQIEQSSPSARTMPTLQFDPSSCTDPAIAAARLDEAMRRFGDPKPQERSVGAKSWAIDPSSFDAAVDFAMGDEAFPEVDFGPTRFHYYWRFHWREPRAGLRPPSEHDPRRSSSSLGVHFGGRRIFVQPTFVFTEPWTSNAFRTFLDRLEPQLPFRIRNQYFKRVLAPKGKSRSGRVLNLPADWR
jgi:hypothetical protein